jgi:hypothetical protein
MTAILTCIAVGAVFACNPLHYETFAQTQNPMPAGAEQGKASQTDVGKTPIRTVKGQILASNELPKVNLKVDQDFKYVGGHAFILYGTANAEQHFFVDADEKGRIKRLYWIQFEGYLPENMFTYNYKATQTVKIGGLAFIADAMARGKDSKPGKPDSDSSRALAFLKDKGFTMASDEVLAQRLVHLVDEQKRNELMIIYLEDLAPMKVTAKDLAPDGPAAARWNEIAKGLLERTVKGLEIVP